MLLKKSGARGSKYRKRIDPINFHIAYEGADAEKEYFEEFANVLLDKRFQKLINFIPVSKSSTDSPPEKVLNDLSTHLSKNNINIKSSKQHIAFIVIDKDHFFESNHIKSTQRVLKDCREKNINVLCSTPCFEIWLILHYIDLSTKSDEYKNNAFKNKKINKSKTFLKNEFSKLRGGDNIKQTLMKLEVAYNNEKKLDLILKMRI